MKLLLRIGFLIAGLSYGVALPMESLPLTSAKRSNFSSDNLTDLGLAISAKSLKAIQKILNRDEACLNQEVEPDSEIFALEYAFFCHGEDEAFMASVVNELLTAGVDLNKYKNFSALHYAAGYGYLDLFNKLLKAGADIRAFTVDGASVAHCAVGMYRDMKQASIGDVGRRRKSLSLSGSSGDIRERLALCKMAPDQGEATILKTVQLSVSQDPIINRLEILKIFFIDCDGGFYLDNYRKSPQEYAESDFLRRFLDGISLEKKQDMRLYTEIKSEIAGELISPRTPRAPVYSKLRGSSIESLSIADDAQ